MQKRGSVKENISQLKIPLAKFPLTRRIIRGIFCSALYTRYRIYTAYLTSKKLVKFKSPY